MRDWETRRKAKQERMRSVASLMEGKLVPTAKATSLLQTLLRPGDRIALEGDNQKRADRLTSEQAQHARHASLAVQRRLTEQWS
jgi:malonate decarboxylase alpha subunit